jgi:hypothetical protein
MDQLIQQIQERTGIERGQAQTAAETAVGFIKDRLPDPIAGQVDSVIGDGSGKSTDSPMSRVGDMFGG